MTLCGRAQGGSQQSAGSVISEVDGSTDRNDAKLLLKSFAGKNGRVKK